MKKLNDCYEAKPEDIGMYIRLGGMGIMDGLKGEPTKNDCYRVLNVTEYGISFMQYRARRSCFLPAWNFTQAAELYTAAEFKAMGKAY